MACEDLSTDADYFACKASRQLAVVKERARSSELSAGAVAVGADAAAEGTLAATLLMLLPEHNTFLRRWAKKYT